MAYSAGGFMQAGPKTLIGSGALWGGSSGSGTIGATGFGLDPAQDDRNRRNNMFSWLQAQYGGGGRGPKFPKQPDIDTSGIWSGRQIDQNVNAMRAKNEATAGTRMNDMNQNVAARGYGTGSPLAQAMEQMIRGQTMATNTEGERATRWDAAKGNRQMTADTETARSNAWAQAVGAMNQRSAIQAQRQAAILSAMSGLA